MTDPSRIFPLSQPVFYPQKPGEPKAYSSMATALPRVQLIGHTVYIPPVDDEGEPILPELPGATWAESLIEFAGRSCYESFERAHEPTATMEGYLRNIFAQGHLSICEHPSATFYVTGISRSLAHEWIRHRHISPSELSQRYVDRSEAPIVLPPAILPHVTDSGEIKMNEWVQVSVVARNTYRELVKFITDPNLPYRFGRKKARGAARGILPEGLETKMVMSANHRGWMEFLTKRDAEGVEPEMQRLAVLIIPHLIRLAPNIYREDFRNLWDARRRIADLEQQVKDFQEIVSAERGDV